MFRALLKDENNVTVFPEFLVCRPTSVIVNAGVISVEESFLSSC